MEHTVHSCNIYSIFMSRPTCVIFCIYSIRVRSLYHTCFSTSCIYFFDLSFIVLEKEHNQMV